MLIWAAGLLVFPPRAKAEESKVVGSIAVRQEYNDNLFFDSAGGQRDFVTTVSPGLDWTERTELLDFALSGRLDALRYWMNHEFDAVDFLGQSGVQCRPDPRLSLSAEAGMSRDSRPDRDIEVTGLVLGTQPRDRWFYTLGGSYLLSEMSSLGLQFNQSEDEYKDPALSDSRGYRGSIFFARDFRDLHPSLKGRANFGYGRYYYETSETEGYRWTLGAEGALSETWGFVVDLGLSRTRSKYKVTTLQPVVIFPFVVQVPVTEEKTSTAWGGVGQIGLSYRDDETGGGISLQQDISPASGTGTVWSTILRMYLDQRFTYELNGGLSAGYYYNQAERGEFSTGETRRHTFNLSARLRYDFSKDMSVEASYAYSRVLDQIADTRADRSLFMVRFFIQQDLLGLGR
ncbi:MAG: hypothetical protein HXY45_04685 [Syntrophaceae bacterium]|nr:hypothetical protein [Syntrophaceae bacterium]